MKFLILSCLFLGISTQIRAQELQMVFEENFESPSSLARFDFAIHHPVLFFQPIRSWKGDHSESCGPPPTTRDIQLPGNRQPGDGKHYDLEMGGTVYWCAPGGPETGHLMTTFNTRGYAQIDFSPRQVFEDVTRVCWDQNMTDLGVRKWTQMVVVGMDIFKANGNRLDYVSPRVDDAPASLGTFLSEDTFMLEIFGGSTIMHTGRNTDLNFRGFLTEDKKRRFTVCATDLENGTIKIELERETSTETRILEGAMPNGKVRVIFQDDTYNARKSPPKLNVPDPFTWHWDNIRISGKKQASVSVAPQTAIILLLDE